MTAPNRPDEPGTATDGGTPTSRAHRFRKPTVIALAVIGGGLVVTPHALQASAAPAFKQSPSAHQAAVVAPTPPVGSAWLQGALTDQAGHGLDNVNVEVWPNDPAATAPVASNLSYGGLPADGRHTNGAWRVQVPVNTPYRLLFSAVGGQEDGDAYRMQWYGAGRPIMARTAGRALATASAVAPAIRNLGTTQLVHEGQVTSSVKATLQKPSVKAGKKGTLKVSVSSPFVSNPTGKVAVRVKGRKLTDVLGAADHGKTTIALPKLKTSGKHQVTVSYLGSGTVQNSKAKPVKLTVKPKK